VFGHAGAVDRELHGLPGAEIVRLRLRAAIVQRLSAAFGHLIGAGRVAAERFTSVHVQPVQRTRSGNMLVMMVVGRSECRRAADSHESSESKRDGKVFDRSPVPARRQRRVVRCHFHSLFLRSPLGRLFMENSAMHNDRIDNITVH
jgi:hypothetical protein